VISNSKLQEPGPACMAGRGEADHGSGHGEAQQSKKSGGNIDVRGVNVNKYRTGLRSWMKGNSE